MRKSLQIFLKRFKKKKFDKILLNNQSFILPEIDLEENYKFPMNEFWMIDLFKKINFNEGCFLDVGANIGQTLLKLRAVSNIPYVGFEPNFNCVSYLNRIIQLNKLQNVVVIPVALSAHCEIKKLYSYSSRWDSSASVIAKFRKTQITYQWFIPSFDFETINATLNINDVSIIKIDVEGSELEVLKGLENKILENRPLILLEILPVYNETNKDRYVRQKEIEGFFENWEYKIFRIIKSKNKIIKFDPINEIGIHSNLEMCDYLIKPKENKINLY